MGAPSKYQPDFDEQAYKLALLGMTDKQLAIFFGVTEQTINNWKHSHPSFFESLKKGKQPADSEVVDALYGRAKGAEWIEQKEVKLRTVIYENGKRLKEEERVEVVELTKRAPPDTTACIFWLKNRQPVYWRDKQEILTTKEMEIGLAEISRIISEEVRDPEAVERIAHRFASSFGIRQETGEGAVQQLESE
jgi:hypothetical protein